MEAFNPVAAVVAAYLLGSLAFAVIVSRVMGLSDPRTFGSKNPGATNVLRSGSKPAAIVTLLLDAMKGLVPVLLVKAYGARWGLHEGTMAMVGLAAFLGHLYPVFFRFQGGKGVATALGVLLGVNVWLGLGTLVTWLVVAYAFRYSSLAALVAALFAPFYYGLLFGIDDLMIAITAMSVLLIYRHAKNIGNLLAGKESRIGSKAGAAAKKR
jgi:glycerol-3-phosphate acyltransferase PlsY